MGTTYLNCQVRTDSQEAVVAALTGLLKEPAYVAPAVSGWVGVYPEGGATNPEELAKQLSAKLFADVFCWNIYDSDIFSYTLYENGEVKDEFNSAPSYFEGQRAEGDDSEDELIDPVQVQGKPEILLPLCVSGTTLTAIQTVLHPKPAPEAARKSIVFSPISDDQYLFADYQASDLAKLLGIAEDLAPCRYRDIAEAESEFADWQFRLVGDENLSQVYKDRKIVFGVELMQHPEKMQKWLQKGANPNFRDNAGLTILFRWAQSCLPKQVETLLKAGADPNAETDGTMSWERGVTPLMVAVGRSYEQQDRVTDTVKLLLEAGADVNARSENGRTALSEALAMTDWQNHKRKLSRAAPEDVLRKLANWSAQVVEMLRAAGATE